MDHFSAAILYSGTLKSLGIVSATIVAILGYKLFVKGVDGSASFVTSVEDRFSAQLLNASPGLFFLLAGCAVIAIIVFRLEVSELSHPNGSQEFAVKGPGVSAQLDNHMAWDLFLDAEELARGDRRKCVKLRLALLLVDRALEHAPTDRNANETLASVREAFDAAGCAKGG